MAGLEDEGVAGQLEGGRAAVPVDPARAFDRKPIWKRLIVILAGVTMNMVFAFVVYAALAYAGALEPDRAGVGERSEEHTSELQSPCNLVCRLLLEKKKTSRYQAVAPLRA